MDYDALKTMFEMHIKECDGRDARNSKAFEDIKEMFKGIWDSHDLARQEDKTEKKELREAITKLQIRAAMALGGLMAIGKFVDWVLAWVYK